MENIKQSISYVKGLMDGLELDCDKKEAKVLYALVEVLDTMEQEIELLGAQSQYCEEMIDDLLEEDCFEGLLEDEEYLEDEDYEGTMFIEFTCPHCKELVDFEEKALEENDRLVCPNCAQWIDVKN